MPGRKRGDTVNITEGIVAMEQAQTLRAVPTYSSLAIFSLVFAVLAWTVMPLLGVLLYTIVPFSIISLPLLGSAIASVSARVAQKQIRNSQGALRGEGPAKAARIISAVQYALFGLIIVLAMLQMYVITPLTGSRL